MSGIQMALLGSAESSSNTIAVTVGSNVSGGSSEYGFSITPYGSFNYGSRAPAGVTIFSGATLWFCAYFSGFGFESVSFVVNGDQTATSWTSMTVDGTVYNKSASFAPAGTYNSGNNSTSWGWIVFGNPFGTSGTKNVVFA